MCSLGVYGVCVCTCVCVYVFVCVRVYVGQVNKLVELLSQTSPYARASYTAFRHPHVMICGCLSFATIHDFLEEFFHPDHGIQDTKVFFYIQQKVSVLYTTKDRTCRG